MRQIMYLCQGTDRAAKEVGVNFIGGFQPLFKKGYQKGMKSSLIDSRALGDRFCLLFSQYWSTKTGINDSCPRYGPYH